MFWLIVYTHHQAQESKLCTKDRDIDLNLFSIQYAETKLKVKTLRHISEQYNKKPC